MKVLTDKKSFTIKVSKWARGGKNGRSALLNSKGNMCCLGFYTKACGFDEFDLKNISAPEQIVNLRPLFPEFRIKFKSKLVKYSSSPTKISKQLMTVNDSIEITDDVRKIKLRELFAKMDVKVRFVK